MNHYHIAFRLAGRTSGHGLRAVKVGSSLADDIEVIVVDDGSRDATADEVRALQASEPRVRLLVHERNLGYGSAVFTGLTNASKELVDLTDADRQFDLSELPALLAKIEGGVVPRHACPTGRC
jgi:glycosyltransferase involved in cell wall biosynthesis